MTDRSIAQEEKRRLLLDAAVRVFARSGYHDCRVGDITEEAGVAHGLLYHYFKSKDEVLEAVFRDAWGDVLEAFRAIEESDEPPREQLGHVAAILLRSWRRNPDLVRVLVREIGRSPKLQGQVDELGQAFTSIERIVAHGQQAGAFRSDLDRAPALLDLLRRDRGDPHRLGARPAARRGRRRGNGRADGDRGRLRRDCRVSTRRGLVWILGLGAFGLAFSITTTAAYLPPLLENFTDSNTMIAAVLAAEGVFALTLPLVIGPWSDTFKTPMGRRRPFMLAALGPMGFCLAIMAFMPNIWTMTLIVLAFFFAYYVYEPPYRGLYPDVLHESMYGRSQGVQHILRGTALGLALVGGGFLLKVWDPGAVPARRLRDDGGLRRLHLLRARARERGLERVPRRPQLREDQLGRLPRGAGGAPLPVRERGVGGDVRRDADVRRPLHHEGARPAAVDVVRGAGHGRRRVRPRRAALVEDSATGSGSRG